MPLSPEQDDLCRKLEQKVAPEIGLAAAALIRQQASEIDSLWDRLTQAYVAMRGGVGDDSRFEDEIEELQRLARSKAHSASAAAQLGHEVDGITL
jgi:hypothetical protein